MPICVYSDMRNISKGVTDTELLDLLADLNAQSTRNWELEERTITEKRWFRKPITRKVYSLYLDCHGEWQVMNFDQNGVIHERY